MKRKGNELVKQNIFSDRVRDALGNTIGFVKKNSIYRYILNDDGLKSSRLWFVIGRKNRREKTRVLFDETKNNTAGFIDRNHNIILNDNTYAGTIVTRKKFVYFLPYIFSLFIVTGLSLYFSSYVIQRFGIPIFKPVEYPTIRIMQLSDRTDFNETEQLDIFNNMHYKGEKIIPAGFMGCYDFVVENMNEQDITYDIIFSDINEAAIPMLYRLKLGNAYVLGNRNTWLTIDKMDLSSLILPAESSALLSLEWKWDENSDDEYDTKIGNTENAVYTLSITVRASLADSN